MSKRTYIAILSLSFIVLFAFLPVNVLADTVTIQPSDQDVTIYSETNYNHLTYMSVIGRSAGQMRCLVQFDLSLIPSGSTINSANLSLYYLNWDQNNPAGRIYWAYRVSQSWIESSATWNTYDGINLWTTPGSDYTITGGASAGVPSSNYTWMMWNVTDIVKAWIEDGQPNNGFVIRDGDETGSTVHQSFFSTSEASSNQPILEVSYTEVPEYYLKVNIVGSGSVTVNGSSPYPAGSVLNMTAAPAVGWEFTGWSGDLSGSTIPEYLTMDSNKTVTATFIEVPVGGTIGSVNRGYLLFAHAWPIILGVAGLIAGVYLVSHRRK